MVKKICLDCAFLREREEAHVYLARMLDFPDYYGKNLDALFDCLTEMGPCAIVLEQDEALEGYGRLILNVLEEAAQANPNLVLEGAAEEELP